MNLLIVSVGEAVLLVCVAAVALLVFGVEVVLAVCVPVVVPLVCVAEVVLRACVAVVVLLVCVLVVVPPVSVAGPLLLVCAAVAVVLRGPVAVSVLHVLVAALFVPVVAVPFLLPLSLQRSCPIPNCIGCGKLEASCCCCSLEGFEAIRAKILRRDFARSLKVGPELKKFRTWTK